MALENMNDEQAEAVRKAVNSQEFNVAEQKTLLRLAEALALVIDEKIAAIPQQ